MNDRYGVDPGAATSVIELASLLRQFGPEHGRFILDFPPDWHSEVRSQFQEIGDVQRKHLLEWLYKTKRSLLPTAVRYKTEETWAKNAEFLKDAQGIIGPAGSRDPFKELGVVLTDPNALPDCRGGHIPRTAIAYAEVARPLLQISSKVVLVDRYFRLRQEAEPRTRSSSHYHSLKALIQAAHVERKVEVFKLMVSRKCAMIHEDGGSGFEAELSAIWREVGTSIKMEYELLHETHSLDRHPRYLLGNECGLRFDWGFDTARRMNDKSTNHVEWIGGAALKPLLEHFM